jgi:hypothetical protein
MTALANGQPGRRTLPGNGRAAQRNWMLVAMLARLQYAGINDLTTRPDLSNTDSVPDKEGAGIGLLKLQGAKPLTIDGFFFAHRMGFASMEGRVRGQKCPLVTCGQQSNLARSSTPIGLGVVDFQINHKEHHHVKQHCHA